MKKILCILGLVFCLSSCNSVSENEVPDAPDEFVTVNILQMNDIHGHIEQTLDKREGLANASYLVNKIRNEDELDNTILIANGDMLQETALSRVTYGRVVIEAMNEMGFDMIGIGNHEFDWGLDTYLAYFDGNLNNGEANFPLLNANVYKNGALVVNDKNVFSSLIVEKDSVKVGLISYIGDVYSSINANMTVGYEFKAKPAEIASSVNEIGKSLKDAGADIVVVNIHGGESSSVADYKPNQEIAKLKYGSGYLVDAVINGHTHTRQDGQISRSGGLAMPVIQSSGKLADFGRIDLTFNVTKKIVTKAKMSHISIDQTSQYDTEVQKVVDDYYAANKDTLEEVYCTNRYYIGSRTDNLYHYVANLMMAATDTNAAICNTGAFRNGVEAGDFDFDKVYGLSPFDNHLIICEISGADLATFYAKNKDYEFVYTDRGSQIATDEIYKIAIIDYVYFGNYFAAYRDGNYVDSNLVLRDLIISDLRLRKNEGFNIYEAYNNIKINSSMFK